MKCPVLQGAQNKAGTEVLEQKISVRVEKTEEMTFRLRSQGRQPEGGVLSDSCRVHRI